MCTDNVHTLAGVDLAPPPSICRDLKNEHIEIAANCTAPLLNGLNNAIIGDGLGQIPSSVTAQNVNYDDLQSVLTSGCWQPYVMTSYPHVLKIAIIFIYTWYKNRVILLRLSHASP